MPSDPRPFVPSEASIIRIAKSIQESSGGMWDFGQEYSILNQAEGFNYAALSRAVKDQHAVDLYPPSVASKFRKAYEKWCLECGIPLSRLKQYSPYYLYELMLLTDITPANVNDWLTKTEHKTRADLVKELKGDDGKEKEAIAMLRLPESVYQMLQEAAQHVSISIKRPVSNTQFVEFVSELVLNTQGTQVRRLYEAMHGDYDEAPPTFSEEDE